MFENARFIHQSDRLTCIWFVCVHADHRVLCVALFCCSLLFEHRRLWYNVGLTFESMSICLHSVFHLIVFFTFVVIKFDHHLCVHCVHFIKSFLTTLFTLFDFSTLNTDFVGWQTTFSSLFLLVKLMSHGCLETWDSYKQVIIYFTDIRFALQNCQVRVIFDLFWWDNSTDYCFILVDSNVILVHLFLGKHLKHSSTNLVDHKTLVNCCGFIQTSCWSSVVCLFRFWCQNVGQSLFVFRRSSFKTNRLAEVNASTTCCLIQIMISSSLPSSSSIRVYTKLAQVDTWNLFFGGSWLFQSFCDQLHTFSDLDRRILENGHLHQMTLNMKRQGGRKQFFVSARMKSPRPSQCHCCTPLPVHLFDTLIQTLLT